MNYDATPNKRMEIFNVKLNQATKGLCSLKSVNLSENSCLFPVRLASYLTFFLSISEILQRYLNLFTNMCFILKYFCNISRHWENSVHCPILTWSYDMPMQQIFVGMK